jgi:hypothetical protein
MKDKDAKISGLEVQSQDKMVNSEFEVGMVFIT